MKVGRMSLERGIPADFMAVSSVCSPRFPKHIRVAKSVANGKAVGTVMREKYKKSFPKTDKPRSLPIKSVKYIIKNLIRKINTTTAVVSINGPMYALTNNLSIFFIEADFYAKIVIFCSKTK